MRLPFNGSYRLTQPFGVNPAAYKQFNMIGHNGLDFGLPTGTTVVAATEGIARTLEDPGGFGHYIEVAGPQYRTIYAHLQKFLVTNGQHVTEGQAIALSNNTGNSTGPHLHFGVKPLNPDKNNGYFGAIDPQPILQGGTMPSSQDKVDDLSVRLGYNLAFKRQPSDEEIRSWSGKVTQAEFDRALLGSAENKNYQLDHDLGVKARTDNWADIVSKFTDQSAQIKTQQNIIDDLNKKLSADPATELKPGKYIVKGG